MGVMEKKEFCCIKGIKYTAIHVVSERWINCAFNSFLQIRQIIKSAAASCRIIIFNMSLGKFFPSASFNLPYNFIKGGLK